MTEEDYARHLDELDRLLNDPNVPIEPERIWRLIDELAEHDSQVVAMVAQQRTGAAARGRYRPTQTDPE